MPTMNSDREQKLQRLADENGYWAEEELRLIKAIRQHKRKLAELPDIILRLEIARVHVTVKMRHAGAEYDALEAEGEDDCPAPCDGCVAVLGRGEDCPLENTDQEAERDWAEVEDAEFRAWADDRADEYSDFLLTTQPPRPNPFGLFKEPG